MKELKFLEEKGLHSKHLDSLAYLVLVTGTF